MLNSIYIEITDTCNLNCSFCPCGKQPQATSPAKKRSFMDSALFERCLQQAELHAQNVYFHILGEPTLHPGFVHYLKVLETTPLKLNLTTNGTTIARVGMHLLQSPALRQVNFSTHAYGELEAAHAEKHLQDVLDFCQMALAARPDLYINLRLWNAGDFPDANRQKEWNQFLIAQVAQTFDLDGNAAPDIDHFCSRHKSFPVKGRLYLHQDSRFEWPGNGENSNVGTCHALETHVGILHDGRVVPCCLDYQGKIAMGNILNQSLDEILKSPLAISLQEGFQKRELRHPLCQKCTFCKRFG
ncbi:MAG: SPASM domain-containing protein [Fibrobacter sp.]|nr:SPASM domain-containing protein [Fibrobacter sp.]